MSVAKLFAAPPLFSSSIVPFNPIAIFRYRDWLQPWNLYEIGPAYTHTRTVHTCIVHKQFKRRKSTRNQHKMKIIQLHTFRLLCARYALIISAYPHINRQMQIFDSGIYSFSTLQINYVYSIIKHRHYLCLYYYTHLEKNVGAKEPQLRIEWRSCESIIKCY